MPRIHRTDLLAEVADLYYLQDWTQSKLARHTGLSQSQISRMLREARDRGIVQIHVHRPLRTATSYERQVGEALGLADCRVLAIDPAQGEPDPDATSAQVGALAAQYLQDRIADRMVIGVGWGSMVRATITSGILQGKRNVTVVQIQGGVGGASQDVDGARLTAELGRTLGATTHYLNAPMIVADPSIRIGLMRDPHIRRTIELGRTADVSIVGIGAISPQSGLYRAGYLNDDDLAYIERAGAVGDVCGHYFREDGSSCPLEIDDRILGLAREALQAIPIRVGVAYGTSKAASTIGAARSRLINILITDEPTARTMLDLLGSPTGTDS
ncbi:MAG: sugar-binding transcriptional regulator [Thermomicrobiales bacterium]